MRANARLDALSVHSLCKILLSNAITYNMETMKIHSMRQPISKNVVFFSYKYCCVLPALLLAKLAGGSAEELMEGLQPHSTCGAACVNTAAVVFITSESCMPVPFTHTNRKATLSLTCTDILTIIYIIYWESG